MMFLSFVIFIHAVFAETPATAPPTNSHSLAQTLAAMTPIKPTPAVIAEAEKLIEATHAIAMGQQLAGAMTTAMLPKIGAGSWPPQKLQATQQIIKEEMANAINATIPELKQRMIMIYAQNFTAEELHAINEFYATPAGQKTIELMPKITQQAIAIGISESEKMLPAMEQRIRQRFVSAGITLN